MDLALIIDDTINQYKHKTPMPLKSKFKKIFDDAWGKAHLMQMEDLPAEEKYAFSLFYKKANDTMTDEEKEKDEWSWDDEDPVADKADFLYSYKLFATLSSDEFKKTAAAKKNLCGCRSNWRLEAKKSPVVPGK